MEREREREGESVLFVLLDDNLTNFFKSSGRHTMLFDGVSQKCRVGVRDYLVVPISSASKVWQVLLCYIIPGGFVLSVTVIVGRSEIGDICLVHRFYVTVPASP